MKFEPAQAHLKALHDRIAGSMVNLKKPSPQKQQLKHRLTVRDYDPKADMKHLLLQKSKSVRSIV